MQPGWPCSATRRVGRCGCRWTGRRGPSPGTGWPSGCPAIHASLRVRWAAASVSASWIGRPTVRHGCVAVRAQTTRPRFETARAPRPPGPERRRSPPGRSTRRLRPAHCPRACPWQVHPQIAGAPDRNRPVAAPASPARHRVEGRTHRQRGLCYRPAPQARPCRRCDEMPAPAQRSRRVR